MNRKDPITKENLNELQNGDLLIDEDGQVFVYRYDMGDGETLSIQRPDGDPTRFILSTYHGLRFASSVSAFKEAQPSPAASGWPSREAPVWVKPLAAALAGYEADWGSPLDDMHELGRIGESRATPSFRIRVGHIRDLLALFPTPTQGDNHDQ